MARCRGRRALALGLPRRRDGQLRAPLPAPLSQTTSSRQRRKYPSFLVRAGLKRKCGPSWGSRATRPRRRRKPRRTEKATGPGGVPQHGAASWFTLPGSFCSLYSAIRGLLRGRCCHRGTRDTRGPRARAARAAAKPSIQDSNAARPGHLRSGWLPQHHQSQAALPLERNSTSAAAFTARRGCPSAVCLKPTTP